VLGQPGEDLAWFLFLDKHPAKAATPNASGGFPPVSETIAWYSERLGRELEHMEYYEVLSGFKFTVIMSRIAQASEGGRGGGRGDWIDPDNDLPYNNNCSRLLDQILEGLL
jgi:aminoglycoside phosphotransferase (APT) family kinase protein